MASPPTTTVRQLVKDGPAIPAFGLGPMGFSIGYGYGPAESDEDRFKLLDRAWEMGCTSWDTADVYADSEDVIGKWFKLHPERRTDVFLVTKFGLKPSAEGTTRLGVDRMDLYYLHRPDPEVSVEKTIHELKGLLSGGKVKCLSLSEVSSTTLRRAHAIHPISAVQMEYNPWSLEIENSSGTYLLDTCKELGVSVFAYSPLGRGILTRAYRSASDFAHGDIRSGLERYQGENFQKNLDLVDKFADISQRKGCTAAQLVPPWLVAQGPNVFVIPRTKKVKYLGENFGASKVMITLEEEQDLRRVVSEVGVGGDRDPSFGAFVDTASEE